MADEKNVNENATINEEQNKENIPEAPADQKKEPGKIRKFFSENAGKIKVGLGIAGAVGVGIAADRLGIKLGGSKKKDDETGSAE